VVLAQRPTSGEDRGMRVRECLRSAPVTVPPGCTLAEAGSLLGRHGVGSLLVVEGDRLVGIVTDRDIAVRGAGAGRPPSATVGEVMTADPQTIQGSADVFEAFVAFSSAKARRLPVLEESELAGIVSVDDLLLALVAQFGAVMSPVAHEVVHPA
jgi:CBS domain-containing protein